MSAARSTGEKKMVKKNTRITGKSRRNGVKRLLAWGLCSVMVSTVLLPFPSMADKMEYSGETAVVREISEVKKASEIKKASESNAQEAAGEWETVSASMSNALRAVNSLGDIWDSWSGKTSFEFLNGSQGDGSKERPFLIKNREQLMGLSELTAMGMVVADAEGADYAGDYSGSSFALGGNIDMQGIDWIPIGFYRDSSEMPGDVENPFQGNFDGNGYTIKNIKMNKFPGYDHVGLFGKIENSMIHDVAIIPDTEIKGNDRVGTAAGCAVDSEIRNVTVKNAALKTSGISGGIAGEIQGTVIENAVCSNVIIDAQAGNEIIYAGGIAGVASDSVIVDCDVSTGSGSTARIQGTGYIGGITGYQNFADIYNVHVNGTIGGYHSTAIGGITGSYVSGKLKVARFEGIIGNSQLGSMAREGTFIGTRQKAASNFDYIDDVAYLFADSESKISANVCGSEIPDDNDYTYAAHIGYWHGSDLYFTLVQGGSSKNITERYFYEELEEGILTVMDETEDDRYTIDHYAPNSVGRPVRGYLINVNQIDTVANGRNFYDVAALEVKGSSQYSRMLDKDNRGAVAAGSVVSVNTSPNNTETEKFQMDGNPYYINAEGKKRNTSYSADRHCYTFTMPTEDIAVDARYKKVAVAIDVNPDTYHFAVTQTRTGNRKNPVKTTEIKNREGKLIARYINGVLEQGTEVQPVTIHAVIDTNNDVSDNRVRWSVDDADLVQLAKNDDEDSEGYTAKSASVSVNLKADFFRGIIERLERTQQEENYRYKIPNTIYGAGHQSGGIAILTAETRPSASFEGKPCTANSRINVTFQILDNTLVAAEGAALDKRTLEYTVTRHLTGSRIDPEETITVTEPQTLTAEFTPDYFSKADVTWKSSDPSVLGVSQEEASYKEALVCAYKDAKWIRDIIASDNGKKENDRYTVVSGGGERNVNVTVEGKDNLGNHAAAECAVTVRFITQDDTAINPEGITLNRTAMEYSLSYDKAGDIDSTTIRKNGFEKRKLTASVIPVLEDTENHRPYDRGVIWTSSDPSAVAVDASGSLTISDEAPWIREALVKPPYQASKTVEVTAWTKDGKYSAACRIFLNFRVNCIEADRNTERFQIVLTKTGKRSAPVLTYTGQEAKKLNARIYSEQGDLNHILWTSSDSAVLEAAQDGTLTPVLLDEQGEVRAQWIKELLSEYQESGSKEVIVTASTADRSMVDSVIVTLEFKVIDKTYTSSGSGGISGSGGGGSTGVTPGGKTTGPAAPVGAVNGTWTQAANGKWLFASNRTYASEWAYISNPYAVGEQPEASWFCFDAEGFMITGWHTEPDGTIYYLNPVPDGTQGRMVMGWQLIDGVWYYFNPISDGTRGRLLTDTVIDGVYPVNEKGQWVPVS